VERAEAPHELDEDAGGAEELRTAGLRALEKAPDFGRGAVAPVISGVHS
jgi:hypothetical protein